jgi:hypothetical protein
MNGYSFVYIMKWYDQSGFGNHATAAAYTSAPTYNLTSKLVDFSGNVRFAVMRCF